MDFKNKHTSTASQNKQKAKTSQQGYKAGQVTHASAKLIIPPAVSGKLALISQKYGLPLDLSSVSLGDATPDNVKALRNITSLMQTNSQLLPEILKLAKQLLKAEIQLATFHKKITKAALEHQVEMDKTTADIFLQMAGYAAKGAKLQHRTNTRNDLITKRSEAYAAHYENSVFGDASRIIDTEYQLMASDSQVFTDARIQRKKSDSERKQAAHAYISLAFAD